MFKDFFNATFLKLIGAVFELLLQLYLARRLAPELFGRYAYVVGTGMLLFYLLFGGKVKFIIKNVAVGNDIEQFLKKFRRIYTFPVIALLLAASLFTRNEDLLYIVIFTFFMQLFMDENAALFGMNKISKALATEYILLKFLTLVFIILCAGILGGRLVFILISTYAAYAISFVIQKLAVLRENYKAQGEEVKHPVREVMTFQLIEVFANTFTNIPRMLQYFVAGAAQTAYFSVAAVVRNILTFISGPTVKVFFSDFAKCFHKGDQKKLEINYRNAARWQIYIIIPMFLSVLFYPEVIIEAFGAGYEEARITVLLVSSATFISLLPGPTSNLFQMIGEERFELFSQVLAFIVFMSAMGVFLGLNIKELAVPLGLLVSSVVSVCTRTVYAIRKCRIVPYSLKELACILTFMITESLLMFQAKSFGLNPLLFIISYMTIAVVLHYFLSPNPKDRKLVKELFIAIAKR
ncbi:MAG: hypothetical protein N2484_02690 [Clostridia bacterium]|nr:hypothetical protein [Clostridia bacterium]